MLVPSVYSAPGGAPGQQSMRTLHTLMLMGQHNLRVSLQSMSAVTLKRLQCIRLQAESGAAIV